MGSTNFQWTLAIKIEPLLGEWDPKENWKILQVLFDLALHLEIRSVMYVGAEGN